jgi:hypothetical protein
MRSPRWRGPQHASLQVRLPGSTLAYRIHSTLIADLINTKKIKLFHVHALKNVVYLYDKPTNAHL